jgi:hypothetical protein
MSGVKRRALAVLLAAVPPLLALAPERPRGPAALLGLAVNLENPSEKEGRQALDEVRRTGVSLFTLTLSWASAEPSPGRYHLAEITRSARVLRQSGATLHLDLPLVSGRAKDVPPDLGGVAFDDPKLSVRLGKLLDALDPVLLDVSSLSLGYEADAYFADKPEELKAFRSLFEGAVVYLRGKAPQLAVGVTTDAPTESVAPLVAAALHSRSPVLFYIYSPFDRTAPFRHRPPESLESDWKQLLARAAGRPIAFPEVSYSSSPENGSSPEAQADFVRRLRGFVGSADGRRLLFARYVPWRDPPAPPGPRATSETARRREAFLRNRGLETSDGRGKLAWRDWTKWGR